MLNQFAVEIPTLPVDQCHSHLIRLPEGMLRHSFVSPRRREGPPSILDTHGISRNVFADPHASSSAPYHLRIASMEFVGRRAAPLLHSGEKWKARTKSRSEMPVWTVSQRFSHLQWRRLNKELWSRPTTTAGFRSFWQIPYTATFACWKIRFKTEVCTCSQFPTEAMQWIKEVEMVDSVDDLKSSRSIEWVGSYSGFCFCLHGPFRVWSGSSLLLFPKSELDLTVDLWNCVYGRPSMMWSLSLAVFYTVGPAVEKLKDQFEFDRSAFSRDTAGLTAVALAVESWRQVQSWSFSCCTLHSCACLQRDCLQPARFFLP